MKVLITGMLISIGIPLFSQTPAIRDTLNEITITSASANRADKNLSLSENLEETLDKTPAINLVSRGGYADEVVYRGLNSFQTTTLVDGMHVYGACTDKMDPVTAYVDRSNLATLETDSDNELGVHGINLKLNKGKFTEKTQYKTGVNLGYATNNSLKNIGVDWLKTSKNQWYKINASYRSAENYYDGNNNEVNFTQFEKFNVYLATGFKINKHIITGSFITDLAYNIGYAGLPMDVSSAKAYIGKIEHKVNWKKSVLSHQVYYNNVAHVMDDTKRPDAIMHMDMPGWSETYGFSGNIKRLGSKTLVTMNYELVQNVRKAEMVMYPPNTNEKPMYMETWPEVKRVFASINPGFTLYKNNWKFNYSITAIAAVDSVTELFGQKQFSVFDYDVSKPNYTLSGNTELAATYHKNKWKNTTNVKLGERQATLSELFGFYLYNSQDGYDYIGNPELKNERFLNISNEITRETKLGKATINTYAYFFQNYIYGIVEPTYYAMTIGANGIKSYNNIGNASIVGADATVTLFKDKKIPSAISLNYRHGSSDMFGNLPQMSPFEIGLWNKYEWKNIQFALTNKYVTAYSRAADSFGEQNTKAYFLTDIKASRLFNIKKTVCIVELFAQNIFNQYYTTHTSWKGITKMGRNISVNVKWEF